MQRIIRERGRAGRSQRDPHEHSPKHGGGACHKEQRGLLPAPAHTGERPREGHPSPRGGGAGRHCGTQRRSARTARGAQHCVSALLCMQLASDHCSCRLPSPAPATATGESCSERSSRSVSGAAAAERSSDRQAVRRARLLLLRRMQMPVCSWRSLSLCLPVLLANAESPACVR